MASRQTSLNGDSCTGQLQCIDGTICVFGGNGEIEICTGQPGCICLRQIAEPCTDASDCSVDGEACGVLPDGSSACISKAVVDANPDIRDADDEDTDTSDDTDEDSDSDEDDTDGDEGDEDVDDAPAAPGTGVTGDLCLDNTSCAAPRQCISLSDDNPGACAGTPPCFCFPTTGVTICETAGDCVTEGEECALLPNGVQACFSETFISGSPNVTQVDEGSDDDGDGDGGTGEGESGGEKLTGDLCDETEECLGVRECQFVSGNSVETCGGRTGCICLPDELQFCGSSADCAADGESCARFSSGGAPTCVSDTFIDLRSDVNKIDGDDSDESDDGDGDGSVGGGSAGGDDDDSDDEGGDGSSGDREVPSQGLTGTQCEADSDCLAPRTCSQAEGSVISACKGSACFCYTQTPCSSDADCAVEGEACAQTQGILQICISQEVIDADSNITAVAEADSEGDNLSGEPCSTDAACLAPRVCSRVEGTTAVACDGEAGCFCFTNSVCDGDADCGTAGEKCADVGGSRICLSELAIEADVNIVPVDGGDDDGSDGGEDTDGDGDGESPAVTTEGGDDDTGDDSGSEDDGDSDDGDSDTDEDGDSDTDGDDGDGGTGGGIPQIGEDDSGTPEATVVPDAIETEEPADEICIAVHMLQHLPASSLLYPKHRLARVLCDSANTCATPGHMVVYHGEAMMMRSYCDFVKCEKRIMRVNSPLYRRGLIVESESEGLVLTAFAARWESGVEERMLKIAIRAGL